jgi:pilus assembly protein TadC
MNLKIKEARASVTSDYPSFVNKLILLLNAGMVISSAISKIADDYRAQKREDTDRYFYNELCGMEDRIRSSNSMLATEFSELANRTQSREVMRFSSVLSGSLDTGSSLAESLDRESNLLWEMRKKSAEEKGRIAESKLTFPMVLQLLAIILITVAPAVIQMQ